MRRSNTTALTTFTLPFPDEATFGFTPYSPAPSFANAIRISIPISGQWRMPFHWHPSETYASAATKPACETLTCITGDLSAYVAQGILGSYNKLGSEGMKVKYKLDERTT